jgi:transcriptional regulator with XRE-family HTH domain/uncharacterized protein YxeA
MILADKIIKLRKQCGWSQEELAEKLNVSRQSVSKWESTNSIPELNKILLLAELFGVSTDFLLKDELESFDSLGETKESNLIQIGLEQALRYVESKIAVAHVIAKGLVLCIGSVVPLLFLLAVVKTQQFNLSNNLAVVIGIVAIIIMVSIGISYFIKSNQYESETAPIDDEMFELTYGVHSVISEKAQKHKASYYRSISIGIFLFISSFVPLMIVSMFFNSAAVILMMLIVLICMVVAGLFIVVTASAKHDAYNKILTDYSIETEKSRRSKRAQKLAAFYFPLLTALYLGWSFWTMAWGTTWIIWPVGAVLFAALVGLMELLVKEES